MRDHSLNFNKIVGLNDNCPTSVIARSIAPAALASAGSDVAYAPRNDEVGSKKRLQRSSKHLALNLQIKRIYAKLN